MGVVGQGEKTKDKWAVKREGIACGQVESEYPQGRHSKRW